MKAQLRMAVASVVVIALALTAMSGITYSWISDTDQVNVDVSTAMVKYEPEYTVTEKTLGNAEITGNKLTISGLDCEMSFTVNAEICNSSTIETVYKIVAKPTIEDTTEFTYYDLINVCINDTALEVNDLDKEVTVTNWKMVGNTNDISDGIAIKVKEDYGWTAGEQVQSYDIKTGQPSALEAVNAEKSTGQEHATWNEWYCGSTGGLTIEFAIIAVQGTYPYTIEESDDGSIGTTLPANKIVKYVYTGTEERKIKTATIDLSNVSTCTYKNASKDLTSDTVLKINHSYDDTATTEPEEEFAVSLDDYGIDTMKFDQPVIITVEYEGKITEPVVRSSDNKAEVISSTVVGDTTTVVFSITKNDAYTIEGVTEVGTADELQSALRTSNKSIRLTADITGSFNVDQGTNVTLDLNGHTLDYTSGGGFGYTIINYGTLRIKDSSGILGLIKGTCTDDSNWYAGAVCNGRGGTLTIDSGNFEALGNNPTAITNQGTCTINGGAFYGTGYVIVNSTNAGLGPNMSINGGYFVSEEGKCLLSNKQDCKMEIDGGTFRSHELIFELHGGTTKINGGDFAGPKLFTALDSQGRDRFYDSNITISFDATWNGIKFDNVESIVVQGTDNIYELEKTEGKWVYPASTADDVVTD